MAPSSPHVGKAASLLMHTLALDVQQRRVSTTHNVYTVIFLLAFSLYSYTNYKLSQIYFHFLIK